MQLHICYQVIIMLQEMLVILYCIEYEEKLTDNTSCLWINNQRSDIIVKEYLKFGFEPDNHGMQCLSVSYS